MNSNTSRIRLIFIIVFFSLFFSLFKGSTSIPLYQLLLNKNHEFQSIFLGLRLPRTVTAFVAGGLLALSGSLMQLLLQNPLADPYVLGVSGGAALFTLLMMLLGMNDYGVVAGAWLGSLLSVAFMLLLARKHRWQTHTLLLSGIALACGFSACISFILLLSPDANLHSMLFWLAGDLNQADFPWTGLCILCIGCALCMLIAPGLNLLGRGEKEARALGLASNKYRIMLYLLSSLFTATAVTLAGCIAFVGLIIPHITRLLCGYDHRRVLPISMLLGGSFLTLADTLARSLFAPQQLPVGIIMGVIGVPVFIWLLQK